MALLIRECRVGDAAAICRLSREGLGYDYPLEATRAKLALLLARPGDKILVAELDGAVVGYLHLCDYEVLYADPMKNILGIAVSDQHRRQGIGSLLLDAAESWARDSGAECVRLISGETRTDAHAFYQSRGYVSRKRQLNFTKELGVNLMEQKEANQ